MLLIYNRGYEDYSDTENWLPRLAFLKRIADDVSVDQPERMDDQQLLDTMELLEELMRYYCSKSDFQSLEPVLRKFYGMRKLCISRGIGGLEYSYLDMVFLRINAMLYRGHQQKRQAAAEYETCLTAARHCFAQLKSCSTLDNEQMIYVCWNCVECFREAAEVNDEILDTSRSAEILREIVPILSWLKEYLHDAPGICDQAADLFTTIAGVLSQSQDFSVSQSCYENAIAMYNGLDQQGTSAFYRAKAIWVQCNYGLMKYILQGNPDVMLACEQEADAYLTHRTDAITRDNAIVRSAQGVILFQKAVAFQQNGNLPEAVQLAVNAIKKLESALQILEADYKSREGYYRAVIFRIATRVYTTYVGALDSLGGLYYHNDQPELAEQMLTKALELLTDTSSYALGESSCALIRAEVNQYMSLIAFDKGDAYQAEFYGTQSADEAFDVAQQTGNVNAWVLAVGSCSMMAEAYLGIRNKPKALVYADKGLQACEQLTRIAPDHAVLSLQRTLMTYRKKASRRFF